MLADDKFEKIKTINSRNYVNWLTIHFKIEDIAVMKVIVAA